MAIEKFDKENLGALRRDIEAAIAAVADRHGVVLRLKAMRFDPASFSVSLEGEAPAAMQAIFLRNVADYGLDAAKVTPEGYRLTGYDKSRRSKPWLVTDRNEALRLAPTNWVLVHFRKDAA